MLVNGRKEHEKFSPHFLVLLIFKKSGGIFQDILGLNDSNASLHMR